MINRPEQVGAKSKTTLRTAVMSAMLALTGCTHYTTVNESSMAPEIKAEIAGHRQQFKATCRDTTHAELHLPQRLNNRNPHIQTLKRTVHERNRLIEQGGCKKTLTTRWMCNTGEDKMGEPEIYEAIYCPQ